MERNRIIAWTCGLIVFLLVLMAGKSCSDENKPSKKTNSEKSTENSENGSYEINYPKSDADSTHGIQYDIFGRPIKATEPEFIEAITDEAGNVIEQTTEIFTDENGNVLEPQTETVSEPTSVDPENIVEAETLPDKSEKTEAADEPTEYKPPPGFSGYDHIKYDDEGNPVPTIPPDFVITID